MRSWAPTNLPILLRNCSKMTIISSNSIIRSSTVSLTFSYSFRTYWTVSCREMGSVRYICYSLLQFSDSQVLITQYDGSDSWAAPTIYVFSHSIDLSAMLRSWVLLLATAYDQYVCIAVPLLVAEVWLCFDIQRMPMITRVQSKKEALAGVMRIAPEGTAGAW